MSTLRGIKPWIDALELSIGEPGPFADDASLVLAHLIVAKLTCVPETTHADVKGGSAGSCARLTSRSIWARQSASRTWRQLTDLSVGTLRAVFSSLDRCVCRVDSSSGRRIEGGDGPAARQPDADGPKVAV